MRTPKNIILPRVDFLNGALRAIFAQFINVIEENHRNYFTDLSHDVVTLPVNDTTPSVKDGKNFVTANTGSTAITNFDDAQDGQVIVVIINDTNTSISDGGNFRLSAAFSPNGDDVIQLIHYNDVWYEISRSTN